ncbi:MAG: hypothetical protein K2X44_08060, partial [Magnetospirillum sp.]|nr:hypothetical protein [Magnetospirillum sp.]
FDLPTTADGSFERIDKIDKVLVIIVDHRLADTHGITPGYGHAASPSPNLSPSELRTLPENGNNIHSTFWRMPR